MLRLFMSMKAKDRQSQPYKRIRRVDKLGTVYSHEQMATKESKKVQTVVYKLKFLLIIAILLVITK